MMKSGFRGSCRFFSRPGNYKCSGRMAAMSPSPIPSYLSLKNNRLPLVAAQFPKMSLLSTVSNSSLSEKTNPEIEQLLEVSMEEVVDDEDGQKGIRIAKTHSENMILLGVKEIASKYVELSEEANVDLYDSCLKFKIVSESMQAFNKYIPNSDLTNILDLQDLILVLQGKKGKESEKVWDLWNPKDYVALMIEKARQEESYSNLEFKK